MNKKFIVTGLLVSMLITNTNTVTAFSSTNTVTKDSIENLKIYRKTSLSPGEDNKKFNITFHTSEPLGIEVMEATEVDVLITGEGISGSANLALHDVNNLRGLKNVRVGEKTTVHIHRKGELFLEVGNIKYDGNVDDDFSLDVTITLNGKDYKITPTYDMRKEKITDKVLDEEKFEETIFSKENSEDGALLISDNVRIYVPKSKYIPKDIDASDTLDTHEKIIATYNKVAGLDEKNNDEINRPRENFVLVSARNEQAGYMSAGGQMLDTLPQNIHEYFKKPKTQDVWGMYHEYGHMYEQGWGFIEYWNNMFANTLRRVDFENPNWSWIYGNEKTNYDIKSVIPSYENYLKTGKKGSIHAMYFFLSFIDNIDSDFMAKAEIYYRENGYSRGGWDYIAYFIAKEYKLNVIPYIEATGNSVTSQRVIDDVLENATSSFIYMSDTENFNKYKNISIPPTLKSIFDGKNSIISGMSNPNAEIFIDVDGIHYNTTADENGKFNYELGVDISLDSNVSVASKEQGKETSFYKKLQIKDSTNEIMFKGYKSETFLTLKFDYENKKFKSESSGNPANVYIGGQYIKIEHYDKHGNKKGNYALNGGQTANELANKLNETNYRDGDYLKLYHAEKDRLAINGKVKNAPAYINESLGKVDLNNSYFYIINEKLTYSNIRLDLGFNKDDLEDFIEKVSTLKKNYYTKTTWDNVIEKSNEAKLVYDNNEVSNKEIVESAINLKEAIENLRAINLIEFIGSHSNMFLKLEFDMDNKKFKAISNGEIAHRYCGSAVYATITHYDKKGNEKGKYQIRANETSEAVAAKLNETSFVEGDYLKFTHLEKAGAFRIKGYVENSPSDLSNGVGKLDLNNSFFYLVGESLKYSDSQLDLSANKDDLIVKLEESKKISNKGYTKSSFENLQNKISEGETLVETPNLYEKEVTEAISNIDAAIKNLGKINEVVFKGYNNEIILSLKFDTHKNKFVAVSSGKTANPYF